MIFDNAKAEEVYEDYIEFHDNSYLEKLCLLTTPLIEAIALSISKTRFDDLVQEGHVKLINMANKQSYSTARKSSFYSYLSTILKNCMIDFLRKERDCEQLSDKVAYNDQYDISTIDLPEIIDYLVLRFSYHDSVVRNAASYILQGITEKPAGKSRGVITTLTILYPFSRTEAYVFYHALLASCRLKLLTGKLNYHETAILCSHNNEVSLQPEVMLVLGKTLFGKLSKVLKGAYIKF